jgi:hypothetical protein
MANPRMTLLDLLNKAEQGADPDFLRDGLKLLAQDLMDAEVTQLVAPACTSGPRPGLRTGTGTGSGSGTPESAPSSWTSPSCGRGPTSRACSSPAAATSERCSRWSRRPTSTASVPDGSMVAIATRNARGCDRRATPPGLRCAPSTSRPPSRRGSRALRSGCLRAARRAGICGPRPQRLSTPSESALR